MYVQRVKYGAYMWQNGLQLVKKGLKWAIIKAFRTVRAKKRFKSGSKWAHVNCLRTQLVHDHFWKNAFLTQFFTYF